MIQGFSPGWVELARSEVSRGGDARVKIPVVSVTETCLETGISDNRKAEDVEQSRECC